jgi:hypothetical protein
MPDHRFMYPKVVPVAVAAPARDAAVHNFDAQNVRSSIQASGAGSEQPKRSPSL